MKSVSSTNFGEDLRKLQKSVGQTVQKTLRRQFGKIIKVHESGVNLVQVLLDDGRLAGGGRFVRLKNSPSEIAHRFGKTRRGLRVEVLYGGEAEQSMTAEIIASEQEEKQTLLVPNEVSRNGLFGLFQ